MKLTTYQRALLAKLRDPAVKLEQGGHFGATGFESEYFLCRWDGIANAAIGQPARSTVDPLIAAGLLQRVTPPRWPWLRTWYELSPAGRQTVDELEQAP